MTKIVLSLIICSQIGSTCLEPYVWPTTFNTQYDCLMFGYEEEDITEDQLKYVGPNGEEPYDNYFKEEDRKLGRAKEETDRVFFLDPEQYGGSYQAPPVYIKPKKNVGWMKISSVLSPFLITYVAATLF